jgi:hypothetical protein
MLAATLVIARLVAKGCPPVPMLDKVAVLTISVGGIMLVNLTEKVIRTLPPGGTLPVQVMALVPLL